MIDLLVTVGVFAEVLIAFVIARTARRIDAYAEADTAKALERAAQAEVRAAEANRIAEQERVTRLKLEAELRKQVEDERTARVEMEELLLEQRGSMDRAFQRTGSRTLNPLVFLKALKRKPTGHMVVLANIDGGEPHQFAWQRWHALNRPGTGWSAEIKQLPPQAGWTGMVVRCRNPREDNLLTEPKTACGALLNALLHGTEGFANVANAGSTLVAESDPSLPNNQFVVEVYPQPEALTAPDTPANSKQSLRMRNGTSTHLWAALTPLANDAVPWQCSPQLTKSIRPEIAGAQVAHRARRENTTRLGTESRLNRIVSAKFDKTTASERKRHLAEGPGDNAPFTGTLIRKREPPSRN